MLPVWYDEEGNPQYHVPEELKNLTFGEKLLIQKNAVLIPVVHIWWQPEPVAGSRDWAQ